MKVVFVDNFFYSVSEGKNTVDIVPHNGLLSLAAILEAAGHRVEVFDPKMFFAAGRWPRPDEDFFQACADDILSKRPDVLGFTAYGRSFPFVIRVAQRIKAQTPLLPVLLGGPHPTVLNDLIMREFGCFDLVVKHEAERTILPLVEGILGGADLREIPGLVYREGGEIVQTAAQQLLPDLDELPYPAFHLYPIRELGLNEIAIEAGRGCPFPCTFCSTSVFFKRKYRVKSNERLIAEMVRVRDEYGINSFTLNHDLFGLIRKNVVEFCHLVKPLGFEWKCSMRTDTTDLELVALMRDAGCSSIYFGVETGSPRLQKTVEKRLDLAVTKPRIKGVLDAGVSCTASFITGFPQELETDQDETLDMIGELLMMGPYDLPLQLHLLSPEPGSKLFSLFSGEMEFDGFGPEIEETLDVSLIKSHPVIFSVFYHFRSQTPRWRSLLAAAFWGHASGMLGRPLLAHLCANALEGKLSNLFRACLPQTPPDDLTVEGIRRILDEGLRQYVSSLSGEREYLKEVIRFADLLKNLRPVGLEEELSLSSDDLNAARLHLVDGALFERFDYDVYHLLTFILSRPTEPTPVELRRSRESWYLLYLTSDAGPEAIPFEPELAWNMRNIFSNGLDVEPPVTAADAPEPAEFTQFNNVAGALSELASMGLLRQQYC